MNKIIDRNMDPYELQNRFCDDNDSDFDGEMQLLNSVSDRNLFRFEDFEPFIQKLPQREIDLIEMYYKDRKKQKEIAEFFGVTQGAVSHRLSRAEKRLDFLKKMPKLSEDIRKILNKHFTTFEIDLLNYMVETTCQSKTAELLNKKYKLQGKNVMTQIKVRHKFDRYIDKMKKLKRTHKDLRDCYKLAQYIKNNLYMLHEVILPHFDKGYKVNYNHR
jgi:DNA-directed RNA polymerase specialized sigma24 family protein